MKGRCWVTAALDVRRCAGASAVSRVEKNECCLFWVSGPNTMHPYASLSLRGYTVKRLTSFFTHTHTHCSPNAQRCVSCQSSTVFSNLCRVTVHYTCYGCGRLTLRWTTKKLKIRRWGWSHEGAPHFFNYFHMCCVLTVCVCVCVCVCVSTFFTAQSVFCILRNLVIVPLAAACIGSFLH